MSAEGFPALESLKLSPAEGREEGKKDEEPREADG